MTKFDQKIDFIVTVQVQDANPNGDPLNGNYPRTDLEGLGIMSDVSIKRKIRNRMQDMGQNIFVKSNDRIDDGFRSLQKRYQNIFKPTDADDEIYRSACDQWLDVRTFGQVITFDKKSIGIRGPVSINMAKSLSPVNISSMQITRSTNGMEAEGKSSKSSDTMGTKPFVEYGVYMIKGSINAYFAEKTGFSDTDADILKESLRTLFENDSSSARPEGSMEVKEIFWFTHPSKLGVSSSSKIFDMVTYKQLDSFDVHSYEDYEIQLDEQKFKAVETLGLKYENINGL